MKSIRLILILLLTSVLPLSLSSKTGPYDIIPAPKSLEPSEGSFSLNRSSIIKVEAEDSLFFEVAADFARQVKTAAGYDLSRNVSEPKGTIIFRQIENSAKESYELTVRRDTVVIAASSPNGAFYGVQTLMQLLPCQIYGGSPERNVKWSVPCCTVKDEPEFAYRGMMLDCGRYFMPKEAVKQFIDVMAMHKQNMFHWHLTEDQGWRIEIKKYPKLTEVGAWRPFTADYNGKNPDGVPHGGYYSQEDVREIVEYARHRYVTVIPEIELPGHSTAALAAYPELSCDPSKTYSVATSWGVKTDVYCPNAFTFQFLEDVFTELFDLFPSPYYHIGGDECPKDEWKESEYCQNLIKVLGLKDEHDLQSFFVKRMDAFLRDHGKTVIGWDEILDGSAVKSTIAMSYRGHAPAVRAMRKGIKTILCPNRWCYLDYYQTDMEKEPKAQSLFLPMRKVYNYYPSVDSLAQLSKDYIIGYECCVWGEYDQNAERMQYLTYPRSVAAAEVGWTARSRKDWDSFRARMEKELKRLDVKKVQYCHSYYDVVVNFDRKADYPKSVELTLDYPDAKIRYTVDGTAPTSKSPLYDGEPFNVDKGALVKARGFSKGGKPVGNLIEKQF